MEIKPKRKRQIQKDDEMTSCSRLRKQSARLKQVTSLRWKYLQENEISKGLHVFKHAESRFEQFLR